MKSFSDLACAFVGLGAMGMPIARKLSEVCANLVVSDLDGEKVTAFANTTGGLSPGRNPADAEVIFICLPTPAAVRAVVEDLVAQPLGGQRIMIDLGSQPPRLVAETAAYCEARGTVYCDAPVFGTPSMADAGNLYFLFSGPDRIYTGFDQLAVSAGFRTRYAGTSGTASTVKVLQNALGTINLMAGAEILRICEETDIDGGMFAAVVGECGGIARSTVFDRFAADMAARRDSGEGRLRIAAKDMRAAAELSRDAGTGATLLTRTAEAFAEAMDAGLADDQFSNIIKRI
jgi:3-hydroxyisobutyrate dehydrogenase-like beta-hydroxyacid dehydrogenase